MEAKLLSLERKVAKKIVRSAVRVGSKPMLTAAKANAQSIVGGSMGAAISAALIIRAFKKQKPGQYGLHVMHKPNVAKFVYRTKSGQFYYIPYAIEYGHAAPGRGGKNAPKDVPPRAYMRTAFDATKGSSRRIIHTEMIGGIEREFKLGR